MAWPPKQYGPSRPSSGGRPPIEPGVLILSGVAALIAIAAFRNGSVKEDTIIFFLVLIPSIILHEISHGWLANLFGDPTAKNAGRLTLNPLRHVDMWGTFIIPAALLLTGSGIAFGYAKPVPVNTSRMSKNKSMLVGLVGPATNVVLALLAALVLNLFYADAHELSLDLRFLLQFGMANVVLAVFNMIPIPPLDGASIVERFLPDRYMQGYLQFRQYSMFLLLAIMLLTRASLAPLFDPAIDLWWRLLP